MLTKNNEITMLTKRQWNITMLFEDIMNSWISHESIECTYSRGQTTSDRRSLAIYLSFLHGTLNRRGIEKAMTERFKILCGSYDQSYQFWNCKQDLTQNHMHQITSLFLFGNFQPLLYKNSTQIKATILY